MKTFAMKSSSCEKALYRVNYADRARRVPPERTLRGREMGGNEPFSPRIAERKRLTEEGEKEESHQGEGESEGASK